MTRKGFRKLADVIVELDLKYPNAVGVVKRTKIRILDVLRQEANFVEYKWEAYITKQIADKKQRQLLRLNNRIEASV